MVVKKRYDKGVTDKQVLHRVFTGPNSVAGKYPTIGKFLSSSSGANADSSVVSASVPQVNQPSQSSDQSQTQLQSQQPSVDGDLDLLDGLVTQTLLAREDQGAEQNTQVSSGRAKEFAPVAAQVNELAPTNEANQENNVEKPESAEVVGNPEMAELSKEIQEVSKETKEQREQAEIAKKQQEINDLAAASNTPVAVSDKPVVVLPITAQSKEEAKFKSTKYSVRWLLEWCQKIAKIFSGAVVYKEEIEDV